LSSSVAKAREHYAQCRHDAFRACEWALIPVFRTNFILCDYSRRALEAIQVQWEPNGRPSETAWDWDEIMRRHRDPDRLAMAIWADGRLSGVCLALTTSEAVEISFLEGDPRKDCPLLGKRALITLEASTCYAQGRGKSELRVRPLNLSLERLYIDTYGFELRSPRKQQPYLVKRV
jgi:hypothetical protein